MPSRVSEKTQSWIDAVANGTLTMSQRKVDVLIKIEGDLKPVTAAAKKAGVHLLQLTDDKGNVLLAASKEAFKILC